LIKTTYLISMSPSAILQFVSIYSLYTNCITFSIGLIGNALNILVFTNLKCFRNNRCAFYLTVESISSFINQITYLTVTILTSIYGTNFITYSLILCRLKYIMTQLSGFVIFYMICLAAVYQFCSTNYRFNLRQMCTQKLSQYLVFISICFGIFHSILFAMFLNINPSLGCIIFNQI
jgi:hypothetical protein